ncbi:conserved hypothetical protein [Culex quinquefasciatus]|uniref:Uncharacterized protein n=1 Tax=Culex quinquefasciatus TaxID=7176 RepID=B0W8K8_CULQU|nr:conserved hypothetical protein [Culex quinquefasciatus]|eukprot:XP_001845042.1 conserved hypothetical protein [Culex quinquefasciatus]
MALLNPFDNLRLREPPFNYVDSLGGFGGGGKSSSSFVRMRRPKMASDGAGCRVPLVFLGPVSVESLVGSWTNNPKVVALKRQQAVEDAIALRLASTEMGTQLEALPPGKIYGMTVTEPCSSPKLNSSSPMDITSSTSPDATQEKDPIDNSPNGKTSMSQYLKMPWICSLNFFPIGKDTTHIIKSTKLHIIDRLSKMVASNYVYSDSHGAYCPKSSPTMYPSELCHVLTSSGIGRF